MPPIPIHNEPNTVASGPHRNELRSLLEVENLQTHFATNEGLVRAVDGVSFSIRPGETLCIVGESGCGKSITARSILQLVDPPGKIVGGNIRFRPTQEEEIELSSLPPRGKDIRAIRGRDIAMIFQEPMTSLSPVHTIGNQIMEVIHLHMPMSKQAAKERAIQVLRRVGIPRPEEKLDAYTFQLSGGMRQRAMIARALVCDPKLLIADEPTTALDVTTQMNILKLIKDLQEDMGMAVIFITHDLGVVAEIADQVAVMYLGTVVEQGDVHAIFRAPQHPYTQGLLRSIPDINQPQGTKLASIRGMVPHPLQRPTGCPFHTRCDDAMPGICDMQPPRELTMTDGRTVRCFLHDPEIAHQATGGLKTTDALPTPKSRAKAMPAEKLRTAYKPQSSNVPILEVQNIKMHFPITKGFLQRIVGYVKAVDGVSLTLYQGETLGLVGESGCGKTTLGQTLIRLLDPTAGQILYHSPVSQTNARSTPPIPPGPIDLAQISRRELRPYRREMRMIFQDPHSSLNPRMTVLDIVGEVLRVNNLARGKALEEKVVSLLETVGLRPEYINRYPHAFSGGERQRLGIARALAPEPSLVIADEAVSALDVSIQAQILNLLQRLQAEFGLTYLFIAHDLSVVKHISDRVAVMYVGKIVELAPTDALFQNPKHPYTEALLAAVPIPNPTLRAQRMRISLPGDVADPANPPAGCAFHPRCPYAEERCSQETPPLRAVGNGHFSACHFAERLPLQNITTQSTNDISPDTNPEIITRDETASPKVG